MLTRCLTVEEEFIVLDLLTREPQRGSGNRCGETVLFSDFMGNKLRKIALKMLYSQQKLSNILNGRNILYKPCLDEILVN